jgi:hypothetical protein
MKFKDLIDKYAWDDAQAALLRLYPDEEKSIEGYQQVYEALRSLSPAETKMRICIESVTSDLDGETYEDVSGKDGRTRREASPEVDWNDEQGNKEESFGIEFTDWAEWLGMEIDAETAARYSELEIIGHCLWEMTFFGYTQEKIRQFMRVKFNGAKSPFLSIRAHSWPPSRKHCSCTKFSKSKSSAT